MTSREMNHPEDVCEWCHCANVSWSAPNELWNKVTGHPAGLIICPACFQKKADEMGIVIHFIGDLIRNTRLSSGWKPYPAEKPEKEGSYNVTITDEDGGYTDVRYWNESLNEWGCSDIITAWQPLPLPFTKEG